MTDNGKTPVTEEEKLDEVTDEVTLDENGVAVEATPEKPSVDAEALLAEKKKYEAEVEKYKQDLNKTKSSLQKQMAQQEKEWKKRETELNRKIQEAAMAGMDEDARAKYERDLVNEKLQSAQERENEIERLQSEFQATTDALKYFISQGVPYDQLVLGDGYDALYQSGMTWIMNEFNRLKSEQSTASTKTKVKELRKAPEVTTNNSTPPFDGQSWTDLKKSLGKSEEEIWQMVEQGTLSPDAIPGVKKANKG